MKVKPVKLLSLVLSLIVSVCAVMPLMSEKASAAETIKYKVSYTEDAVRLTLTSRKSSDTIYYTVKDRPAGTSDNVYVNTLSAKSKVTIHAAEYDKNGNKVASLKATVAPRVGTPTVKASSDGGKVTITTATKGAAIYYTTDGTSPTEKSKLYTGSITYTPGVTLKARAYKKDMKASKTVTYRTESKSVEEQVLEIVNRERTAAGVSKLSMTDALNRAAAARAKELSEKFDHVRPDGTECFTILKEYSISYGYAGENIAGGQTSASAVMKSWMESSGHKRNILGSQYKYIGIGCYKSGGINYWVQIFTS